MVTTPTVWRATHKANATSAGVQEDTAIINIGGGRYITVWSESDGGPIGGSPNADLVGQIFDAEGNAVGAEFQVNANFINDQERDAALVTRPDGGFVMVYEDADATGISIRMETRDANGNLVNDTPITIQDDLGVDILSNPSVAMRADGSFLVTYNRSVDESNVVGRIVSADGVVGDEFTIFASGDSARNPDMAVLSNGNYVIGFEDADDGTLDDFDPQYQIFDENGVAVTGAFLDNSDHNQTDVQVAALAGGGFVTVWTEQEGDGDGLGIRARICDNNGAALGDAFTVNFFTASDQDSPDVVALADGGFVVVWDNDNLGSIRGRRFDSLGNAIGGEFIAGDTGDEQNPDVTALSDGRFVVGFEELGSNNIWQTIFDPRESAYNATEGNDVYTARIDGATVNGLGGNDVLLGQAGNDTLNGGAGLDTMEGGAGDDTFFVDLATDIILETAGQGSDTIKATTSYALTAGVSVELLRTLGSASNYAVNLTGNEIVQTLQGNAAANTLNGGGNADVMYGFAGNDIYYVDNAGDQVSEAAGQGSDTVIATATYALAAGTSVELLRTMGSASNYAVNLTGNELVNTLQGNAAMNTLDGGTGADTMQGFAGNDTYYLDNIGDTIIETAGNGWDQIVVTTNLAYTLAAGVDVEVLRTTAATSVFNVNLHGNALDNAIEGNAGANVLSGGAGNDTMTGYGNADIFRFNTALGVTNVDTIIDFNVVDDTIQLDDAVFAGLSAGVLGAGAFHIGAAAADADDRIVYDSATGALFFDSNGSAAGGATQFATLTTGLLLTNADFVVI